MSNKAAPLTGLVQASVVAHQAYKLVDGQGMDGMIASSDHYFGGDQGVINRFLYTFDDSAKKLVDHGAAVVIRFFIDELLHLEDFA